MINKKHKIALIILLAVLIIFSYNNFISADEFRCNNPKSTGLEVDYPNIGDTNAPTIKSGLPEFISYIFSFALMIGGLLAFAILVYGGISYLVSLGDPGKLQLARSRIFNALLGLALLLSSYLFLDLIGIATIEPLPSVGQNFGICLIDSEGYTRIYRDSVSEIKDFDSSYMRFLSGPDELTSVFAYTEKGMKGTPIEIKNFGGDLEIPFSSKNSIFFLWNKPGIYVYEKTDFGIADQPPFFTNGSVKDLSSWNDKAKSLKIKRSASILGNAILFTEPNFRGSCGIVLSYELNDIEIKNLDNVDVSEWQWYYPKIGNQKLSSIYYFKTIYDKPRPIEDAVTFYTQAGCEGSSISFTGSQIDNIPLMRVIEEKNILNESEVFQSFKIIGDYKVLLTTKDYRGPEGSGDCQLFERPEDNCEETLKGTDVYDPYSVAFGGKRVRTIIILPF